MNVGGVASVPARGSRLVAVLSVAFGLVLVVLLAGCGGGEESSSWSGSLPVTGRVYLGSQSGDPSGGSPVSMSEGSPCQGTGGYAGIAEGAVVSIVDGAGKTVGSGVLGPGTIKQIPDAEAVPGDDPYQGTGCVFEWKVAGVPGDGTGYQAVIDGEDHKVKVSADNRSAVHYDLP